jgi:2-polyprenyl-6-hydroxyphenyl methylase/3-demethylubiquinone-9 3-methyltransferase
VTCLWYAGGAEEAARFSADTFPDSRVTAVMRTPADNREAQRGMC